MYHMSRPLRSHFLYIGIFSFKLWDILVLVQFGNRQEAAYLASMFPSLRYIQKYMLELGCSILYGASNKAKQIRQEPQNYEQKRSKIEGAKPPRPGGVSSWGNFSQMNDNKISYLSIFALIDNFCCCCPSFCKVVVGCSCCRSLTWCNS